MDEEPVRNWEYEVIRSSPTSCWKWGVYLYLNGSLVDRQATDFKVFAKFYAKRMRKAWMQENLTTRKELK